MKKVLLVLSIALLSFNSFSQATENDYLEITRDVLKTEKKAAIAEIMNLDDEENKLFWSLYNEYESKNYILQNKRIALIQDFSDNYESLTDEKADELMNSHIAFRSEELKLKKTYYKKFKKIIPIGEAVKFMQAINKIDTLVDAQLAIEIPFVETAQ